MVGKRLAEIVQLIQPYCHLAELEIVAGERPKMGEVALPEDTGRCIEEWAVGEAKREAFVGKLQTVSDDPKVALKEMSI